MIFVKYGEGLRDEYKEKSVLRNPAGIFYLRPTRDGQGGTAAAVRARHLSATHTFIFPGARLSQA
jgi:hypothetical protein